MGFIDTSVQLHIILLHIWPVRRYYRENCARRFTNDHLCANRLNSWFVFFRCFWLCRVLSIALYLCLCMQPFFKDHIVYKINITNTNTYGYLIAYRISVTQSAMEEEHWWGQSVARHYSITHIQSPNEHRSLFNSTPKKMSQPEKKTHNFASGTQTQNGCDKNRK